MKTKFYSLLVLGLLILLPGHAFSSRQKQAILSDQSFQKILKEDPTFFDDSQNELSFFSADIPVQDDILADVDVDDDDDSDGSLSARKKISFESGIVIEVTANTTKLPTNNLVSAHYSTHSYQHPPSHFISLRVFRI